MQDQPAGWGLQSDPNQWSAYYAYGHGYDTYGYGASHDPSLYGYSAYAGYGQYSQQVKLLFYITKILFYNDCSFLCMTACC